jgi:phosphoribosylamine---glycine ligase
MGAYSPAPVVTPAVHARVMREVIQPTIAGMAADGHPFSGFLYAGLMIDGDGKARVVEFNARLGDPEAQVLLMRLKSDLYELLMAATDADGGGVRDIELQWDRRSALGVVIASAGYPAGPRVGDAITGIPAGNEDMHVFHAATAKNAAGELVTSGGRVLTVTALGDPLRAAQQRAYAALGPIRFEGMQWRRDIGHRALKTR